MSHLDCLDCCNFFDSINNLLSTSLVSVVRQMQDRMQDRSAASSRPSRRSIPHKHVVAPSSFDFSVLSVLAKRTFLAPCIHSIQVCAMSCMDSRTSRLERQHERIVSPWLAIGTAGLPRRHPRFVASSTAILHELREPQNGVAVLQPSPQTTNDKRQTTNDKRQTTNHQPTSHSVAADERLWNERMMKD